MFPSYFSPHSNQTQCVLHRNHRRRWTTKGTEIITYTVATGTIWMTVSVPMQPRTGRKEHPHSITYQYPHMQKTMQTKQLGWNDTRMIQKQKTIMQWNMKPFWHLKTVLSHRNTFPNISIAILFVCVCVCVLNIIISTPITEKNVSS